MITRVRRRRSRTRSHTIAYVRSKNKGTNKNLTIQFLNKSSTPSTQNLRTPETPGSEGIVRKSNICCCLRQVRFGPLFFARVRSFSKESQQSVIASIRVGCVGRCYYNINLNSNQSLLFSSALDRDLSVLAHTVASATRRRRA